MVNFESVVYLGNNSENGGHFLEWDDVEHSTTCEVCVFIIRP